MQPLITPGQNIPPIENGLFARAWWMFFSNLREYAADVLTRVSGYKNLKTAGKLTKVTAEGTVGESALSETDVVAGGSNLTHAGAIPKVSATAGALDESAITDDGATVTAAARNVEASGTEPAFISAVTGGTQPGRFGKAADGQVDLALNLWFDGANWVCDDTSKPGMVIILLGGAFTGYTCGPAANPQTPVEAFRVDAAGNYYVAGTQVVGARGAAITAPTGGGGSMITPPSGGTVVDVQARAVISSIIAALSNAIDLSGRTAINDIRARLAAHGLIS